MKFNPELVRVVAESTKVNYVDSLDSLRATALREAVMLTNGNLGAALRIVLLQDQDLFEEVAFLQAQKGATYLQDTYNRFARVDGSNGSVFTRAAAIDAAAGNGDNDFGSLFVEKSIKKRVEMESPLLQYLDGKRIARGTKSAKFPKSSNLAKAAFAANSADLVDLTDTIDDGFDNTAVEAQKFGGTMFIEADTFVKLDAQIVSQILDELTIAYRRGMIDQIINGDGNSPNATGFATNATAVTFVGNVVQTLIKMIATVADVSRGGMTDIFVVTNTAGKTTLLAEKFINPAYESLIDGVEAINFLRTLPIIEENVIVTSGSTPNKTAPLYVGKRGDYLHAVQTDPVIEFDKFTDFKAGGETARIMDFWTSKPHFNDSFAKTTIPTVY